MVYDRFSGPTMFARGRGGERETRQRGLEVVFFAVILVVVVDDDALVRR